MICYIAGTFKAGNSIKNPAVTGVVGQRALLRAKVIDFCNVCRSEILTGNSVIVRFHVTSK